MSLESEVNFSFKLLSLLNASNESTVYSPSSILTSLSMIYAGANGNTANQIKNVIGKDKTENEIIEYYSEFLKSCNKPQENNSSAFQGITTRSKTMASKKRKFDEKIKNKETIHISMANGLFISDKETLKNSFNDLIASFYDGKIEKLVFAKSEDSVKKINQFANESTNGVIKEIINPSDIDESTVIIIINAMYFLGFWEELFIKEGVTNKFYSKPIRQVQFMNRRTGDYNLRKGKHWKALGIPYKSRKAWFYIVLPDRKNGLQSLLKNLNYEFFKDCTTREETNKLKVRIPEMEISLSIDLIEKLKKLGIVDAFNNDCDLTKMLLPGCHIIGKAVHKAVIRVDENGTEAVATSSYNVVAQSSTLLERFNADHPFLFFISTMENSDTSSTSPTPKNILLIGTFY